MSRNQPPKIILGFTRDLMWHDPPGVKAAKRYADMQATMAAYKAVELVPKEFLARRDLLFEEVYQRTFDKVYDDYDNVVDAKSREAAEAWEKAKAAKEAEERKYIIE